MPCEDVLRAPVTESAFCPMLLDAALTGPFVLVATGSAASGKGAAIAPGSTPDASVRLAWSDGAALRIENFTPTARTPPSMNPPRRGVHDPFRVGRNGSHVPALASFPRASGPRHPPPDNPEATP